MEEVQLKCKLKTCLKLLLLCFCLKWSELSAQIGLCSLYILYIILVINARLISVQKKTVIKGGNRVRTDEISQFCSVTFQFDRLEVDSIVQTQSVFKI